jgi:hypothetical protein
MSDSQFEAFIKEVRKDIQIIKDELVELTARVNDRHPKKRKSKGWWSYMINK